MTDITIELVKATEIKQLGRLSRDTFLATFGTDTTNNDMNDYVTHQLSDQQLAMELANPNSEFYFAKIDDQPVGFIKLNVATAQTESTYPQGLELQRIYVAADYQQLGIGRQLLSVAIKRAEQLKKPIIWLGVWENNVAAQHFYHRAGFKRVGEHAFTIGMDQQTDWIMVKNLA